MVTDQQIDAAFSNFTDRLAPILKNYRSRITAIEDIVHTPVVPEPSDSTVYIRDFNPPAHNGGGDDTAAFNAALNVLSSRNRGGKLVLEAYEYHVPNGIVEAVPNLQVEGVGNPSGAPDASPGTTGTVIRKTGSGWIWTHKAKTLQKNTYEGLNMSNVTFLGDTETDGGLWSQTNNNTWRNLLCHGFYKPTSWGFMIRVSNEPGSNHTDTSWNDIYRCMVSDCYNGILLGDQLTTAPWRAAFSSIVGFVSVKSGSRPLQGLGIGMWIDSAQTKVFGGKSEQNNIGIYVTAPSAVEIHGVPSESDRVPIKFDRPQGYPFVSIHSVHGGTITGLDASYPAYEVGPYDSKIIVVGQTKYGRRGQVHPQAQLIQELGHDQFELNNNLTPSPVL